MKMDFLTLHCQSYSSNIVKMCHGNFQSTIPIFYKVKAVESRGFPKVECLGLVNYLKITGCLDTKYPFHFGHGNDTISD